MAFRNKDFKLLAEVYENIAKILPNIGDIVTKKDVDTDGIKQHVVVGIEPQGIWIYPVVNPDYETQKAQLVFTKEINF